MLLMLYFWSFLQSQGIKVGYGGIPGPSGGRDGSSSQAGGCCSWNLRLHLLNAFSPLAHVFFSSVPCYSVVCILTCFADMNVLCIWQYICIILADFWIRIYRRLACSSSHFVLAMANDMSIAAPEPSFAWMNQECQWAC